MKITFAAIAPRRTRSKTEASDRLIADYVARATRYVPCDSELFDSDTAVLNWLDRQPGRAPAYAIFMDSRGQQYTSDEFAAHLGRIRDEGVQRLVTRCAKQQIAEYRSRILARAPLQARLGALISIRNEEGFMAEVQRALAGRQVVS